MLIGGVAFVKRAGAVEAGAGMPAGLLASGGGRGACLSHGPTPSMQRMGCCSRQLFVARMRIAVALAMPYSCATFTELFVARIARLLQGLSLPVARLLSEIFFLRCGVREPVRASVICKLAARCNQQVIGCNALRITASVGGDVVLRDSFAHLLRHPPPHGDLVPGGVHGGSAIAGQSSCQIQQPASSLTRG